MLKISLTSSAGGFLFFFLMNLQSSLQGAEFDAYISTSIEGSGSGYFTGTSGSGYSAVGRDVVVAGDGNIFTIGYMARSGTGIDIWIAKFDSIFNIQETQFVNGSVSGSDYGYSISLDGSGNVYVAGGIEEASGGQNIWIAKYDSTLALLSKTTISGPGGDSDVVYDIKTDSNGNVYAAGAIYVSGVNSQDIWIAKFNSSLTIQSSVTINGTGNGGDSGFGIALDDAGNVYAVGTIYESSSSKNQNIWIAKFDSMLTLLSSATFNGSGNGDDYAYGVALDTSGNVFVSGKVYVNNTNETDIWLAKYSNFLVFQGSATFNYSSCYSYDNGYDVTVDGGFAYVTGSAYPDCYKSIWLASYSSSLVLMASATFRSKYYYDDAFGIAKDNNGNLYSIGNNFNSLAGPYNQYNYIWLAKFARHTHLQPQWNTVWATSGTFSWSGVQGAAFNAAVAADSSYNQIASSESTSSNATGASGLTPNTAYYLQVKISTESDISYIANRISTTTQYLYLDSKLVDPASGATMLLASPSIAASIAIPADAFSEEVQVLAEIESSFPTAPSPTARLIASGVGIEINLDKGLQPDREVELGLKYQNSAVSGLNETKLIMARYDAGENIWVPLVSLLDANNNKIFAKTRHLSLFQIMEANPSGSVFDVKFFPNPFLPSQGHSVLTFSNLPANASIEIFTLAGERVKTLAGEASGMAGWDGTNDFGVPVASDVYFAVIEGAGGRKVAKIALER